MSQLEVYGITTEGDVKLYDKVQHAPGAALHIWQVLCEKYGFDLNDSPGYFSRRFTQLWQAIGNLSLPDQWVLGSTFDNVIIMKEDLPTLITHMDAFSVMHPSWTLTSEIVVLKTILKDSDYIGVCFNQTSVNANPWVNADKPYNIFTDSHRNHWRLCPGVFES